MFGKLLTCLGALFLGVSALSMPSVPVLDYCPSYNFVNDSRFVEGQYVMTTCQPNRLKRAVACNDGDGFYLADQPLEEMMTSNLNAGKDFCIGWNVNEACEVDQEIPIVQNKFFQVDCKDCMFGFSGSVVFELDIFKREMTVGLENMLFDWSIVIDGEISGSWGTSFTKTYNTEVHTLVNTHIGPVPIDITVQLPIQVNFQISSKADLSGEIGIQSQGIIGDLLSIYDKGHWTHEYPTPSWKNTKLVNGKVDESLEITIEVIPSLNLQVDSLFEGTLEFDVRAELDESYSGKLQGCIEEQNTLSWKGEAKLSWFHFDKAFDDIIYQKSIKVCLPSTSSLII